MRNWLQLVMYALFIPFAAHKSQYNVDSICRKGSAQQGSRFAL
jgi:hypothetical protein